jgi:ectoine hydroxylase-related dioxygenase (phytanoyl-CoA dioxygenase family)
VNQFENFGFSLSRNVSKDFRKLCVRAAGEADLFFSGAVKTANKWTTRDGAIKQSLSVHKKSKTFLDIICSDDIASIVKKIFGERAVYVNHSKISYKCNSSQRWAPHQDSAYNQDKSAKGITVCIFLDKVLEKSGAIICYEYSHKEGRKKHEIIFCKNESEPQISVSGFEVYPKRVIEGEIGDILYFDFNTIHSSEGNFAGGARPIFIFDIQEVRHIPLETNGTRAITFNYTYPAEGKILFQRLKNFLRNRVIFPILKKLLFMSHRLGIFPKLKI